MITVLSEGIDYLCITDSHNMIIFLVLITYLNCSNFILGNNGPLAMSSAREDYSGYHDMSKHSSTTAPVASTTSPRGGTSSLDTSPTDLPPLSGTTPAPMSSQGVPFYEQVKLLNPHYDFVTKGRI